MECEFCNYQDTTIDGIYQDSKGNYILRVYTSRWDDYLDDFNYGEIEVKFCPICGRRL